MGLTLKGFDIFKKAMNKKRVRSESSKQLRKKFREQLAMLRGDMVRYIDSAAHGIPNSPLTILVKRSSRPLVDRGDLRGGINFRTEIKKSGTLVLGGVGILRQKRGKDGRELTNIAQALHDGFEVRVTPAVRAAVFAEMRKRQGNRNTIGIGAATGGKRIWRIKGRPFIEKPFRDAEGRIKKALGDAVAVTFQRI